MGIWATRPHREWLLLLLVGCLTYGAGLYMEQVGLPLLGVLALALSLILWDKRRDPHLFFFHKDCSCDACTHYFRKKEKP